MCRNSLRWALALAITLVASVLTVACGGNGDNDMMAVLERAAAAYQARDATAYASLFASDARYEDHSAFGDRVQGREEIEKLMGAWFKIVPENHTFTTELVIRDEHMAVGTWSDEWTDQEGKKVRIDGLGIDEVENGLIVRERIWFDSTPVGEFVGTTPPEN